MVASRSILLGSHRAEYDRPGVIRFAEPPEGALALAAAEWAEDAGIALDRLSGDAWSARRAEVDAEVEETARALVKLRESGRVLPPLV